MKPGTKVGRYEIKALIGQGGMGEVYSAFDPELGRTVALKKVRVSGLSPMLERLKREASTLAQLNHPNICQIYDFTNDDGAMFMTMEWIEGTTLTKSEYCTGKPPLKDSLRVIRTIAQALSSAHSKAIVHRDLKPDNIMITKDGVIKVLDFGLAKVTAASPEEITEPGHFTSGTTLTQMGSTVGSLGYMSPEQAYGESVTTASDIFVLGIIMYELLTGQPPFNGKGEALLQAVTENRRFPVASLRNGKKIPRQLVKLIDTMMDPKTENRSTAKEVVEVLEKELRQGRLAFAATAVAVSVMLTLTGYWAYGRGVIHDLVKEKPARTAVLPITNETGDSKLDNLIDIGMTEIFGTALKGSSKLEILNPATVAKTFRASKEGSDRLKLLAKKLEVRLFVVGRVSRDKNIDTFHCSLVDDNGKVRFEKSVTKPVLASFTPQGFIGLSSLGVLEALDPLKSHTVSLGNFQDLPLRVLENYSKGKDLFLRGNYVEAFPYLEKSSYAIPSFSPSIATLSRCASFMFKPEAKALTNWALLAAQKDNDANTESAVYRTMGSLALETDDLALAKEHFTKALTLARTMKNVENEYMALNDLAFISVDENDLPKAKETFILALSLVGTSNNKAALLSGLAAVVGLMGDMKEKERLLREAIMIAEQAGKIQVQAACQSNLAAVLTRSNRFEESESLFLKTLKIHKEIGNPNGEMATLVGLGSLRDKQLRPLEAKGFYEQALMMALMIKDLQFEAVIRVNLGSMDRKLGNFKVALEQLDKAIKILEKRSTPDAMEKALSERKKCLAKSREE